MQGAGARETGVQRTGTQSAGARGAVTPGAGGSASRGPVSGAGGPAFQGEAAGEVAAIEVAGEGHAMLRRAALWHRLAVEFTLLSLDGPTGAGPVTNAFRRAAAGLPRPTV